VFPTRDPSADYDSNLLFHCSILSKQIEHVQFVLTLLKGRNFTKNSFDLVANGNNIEATFDFV